MPGTPEAARLGLSRPAKRSMVAHMSAGHLPIEARPAWRWRAAGGGVEAVSRDVPAETAWVDLARKELSKPSGRERTGEGRWASVRKALEHARKLDEEDKHDQAEAIRKALNALYAGDPSARDILKGH